MSKKHLIKQNQSKPVPCWLEIAGKSFGKMMHFKELLCRELLWRKSKNMYISRGRKRKISGKKKRKENNKWTDGEKVKAKWTEGEK